MVVSSSWLVALSRRQLAVSSDCKGLGLWLRGLNSVVKLLGGRGAIVGWCRHWLVALSRQLL